MSSQSHSHCHAGTTNNGTREKQQKLELVIRKSRAFWGKTSVDVASKIEHLKSELNEFKSKQRDFHESVIATDNRGRPHELRKSVYDMQFSVESKKTHFKIELEQEYQLWRQIKLEWYKPLIDADFVNMKMEELIAMAKKCKDGVKIGTEKNAVFENLREKWNSLKIELCAGMDECRNRVLSHDGQNA